MQTTPQHPTITAPGPGRYMIDTNASTVRFVTRHLFGLAPVRGTFAIRAGSAELREPASASSCWAEIETASFRTGNPQRDLTVRSRRLLDARRYPVIRFLANGQEDHWAAGPDPAGVTLTGMLTVGDVTKPACLSVERCEVQSDAFTVLATARIDRTAYGVTAFRGLAARWLEFTVEVRCVLT